MKVIKKLTVAEVVSQNMGADHIFSKYKIDFCCGGGDTLENACKNVGANLENVILEIALLNKKISKNINTNQLDIPHLVNLVKSDYHKVISDLLFEVLPYSKKVSEVHGDSSKELLVINQLLLDVEAVLTETFTNSIISLYPIINEITEHINKAQDVTLEILQALQKAITRNEIAQTLIADSFKEISTLSSNYKTPKHACNSYTYLYENLEQLQLEVHKYMHFEKNVLIPKVLNIIE